MTSKPGFRAGRDQAAIQENIELLTGQRGSGLDRAITLRDLGQIGAINLVRRGNNFSYTPNPALGEGPQYDNPTKPQNLQAAGAFHAVLISWDPPNYRGHSYTEIWRATTDNLADAALIGTTSANRYSDAIGGSASVYYWARFVSQNERYGPYAGGIYAETARNIDDILEDMTGQILSSHFALSLQQRVNLIDKTAISADDGGLLSMVTDGQGNNRIAQLQVLTDNQAQQINEVSSLVGSGYAAAVDSAKTYTDQQTGQITAERILKVDANGRVASVGLIAGADTGTAIYFNADTLAVLPPGATTTDSAVIPFAIDTQTGDTFIKSALVKDLSAANFKGGSVVADTLSVTQYVNLPSSSIAEDMLDTDFLKSLARIDPNATTTGGSVDVSAALATTTLTLPAIPSGGLTTKIRTLIQSWFKSFSTSNPPGPAAPSITVVVKRDGVTVDSKTVVGSYNPEPNGGGTYLVEISHPGINWEVQDTGTTQGQDSNYTVEVTFSDPYGSAASYSRTIQCSASEPFGSSGGLVAMVDWGEIENKPSLINATFANGYWGMALPDGTTSDWLRTTVNGLIPYQSGGASSLGTSSWPFSKIYGNTLYEGGTALSSKYASISSAVLNGSSGSYSNAEVPWNAKSGFYVGSMSGFSDLVFHMGNIGGSTPSAQFRFDYKNRGVYYRSARDSYGFEVGWERLWTDRYHPVAWSDLSGGTVSTIPGGGSTGSWGSMTVTGSKSSYAGFYFPDVSRYFMIGSQFQGVHSGSSWQWVFNNGTLTTGTIPWARLTGVPSYATRWPAISEVTGLQSALDAKANLSGATFTGQVLAPSFKSTSSVRYKSLTHWDDGKEALRRVCEIGGSGVAVGNFKGKPKEQYPHRWLIAERVSKISPEVVGWDGQGRPDSLSYTEMVPDLYAAVSEQQRQIEDQRRELEELRRELEVLRG